MLATALALALVLAPQELPIRSWSVSEGLPHERIASLFQDSSGFLWIGTWEGLARFDGNSFTTYGPQTGLPVGLTFAIAESPNGELWFSTNSAGIARLRLAAAAPPDEPMLRITRVSESPASHDVEEIAFDAHGHGWVATEDGLYFAAERADGALEFERRWTPSASWIISGAIRSDDRIAFLGPNECLVVEQDEVREIPGPEGNPLLNDVNVTPSAEGRAILATRAGLFEFEPDGSWRPFDASLDREEIVTCTAVGPDGAAWIGTTRGVVQVGPRGTRRIDRSSGLTSDNVTVLRFDRSGTPWIGTKNRGLACLEDESIETFLPADPGERPLIVQVVEAQDGTIVASSDHDGLFTAGSLGLVAVPGSESEPLSRVQGRVKQDRSGDWWLGTFAGLYLAPGPELDLFGALPTGPREAIAGLPHADAEGRLWVCTEKTVHSGTSTQAFEPTLHWTASSDNLREVVFDSRGQRWILTWDRFWRWRDGAAEELRPLDELLMPRAFLEDHRGWVWVGLRYAGLVFTREPHAPEPRFERLGMRDGLASDTVWSLAEDARGQLWIGTNHGLDRYEVETGHLRHYGLEQGLKGDSVFSVIVDRRGFVWAGTSGGLTRLDPRSEPRVSSPPPVLVRRIEASGEVLPIPEGGREIVSGLLLRPDQENVTIAFDGIDLLHGRALRFQTRLDGVDQEWSPPSPERSVHLAHLAAGDYRLLVRAVTGDGIVSAKSAEVSFRLLAPYWRRPWFPALGVAVVGTSLWMAHRGRVRRILALERIRSRIAADLHDEVGSGLTQLAILSEVARARAAPELSRSLGELADLARSTKDSMSDLVWAIDPAKDRLVDLVQRMRHATAQLFGAQGVDLEFQTPDERELAEIDLAPDWKRHLILFFKEAVSNVARHSAAQCVRISLSTAGDSLRLEIADDGRGFDPAQPSAGHGMASLRARAGAMGAKLELDSAPGRGTLVVLLVPYLSAPRRGR